MVRQSAVSDEALTRALSVYAGMVDKVVTDPERWLGPADGPGAAAVGLPRRLVRAVRKRAMGQLTPASASWEGLPVERRVDWWVDRIGVSAGLAAAAPRVAGALSDRVPLQAALGASAAGLAVCAAARENGVVAPRDWVPLLAKILFERDLAAQTAAVPPPEDSESALASDPEADDDETSRIGALGRGAQRAAGTLWRLARTFLEVQQLLDERPRGSIIARAIAKVPVIGVAGGWLDERGGIRKAAVEAQQLIG